MPTVVGVTLRNAPSAVLIDPADVELELDDVAVVETERGTELGRVSEPPREREPRDSVDAANSIARAATDEDLAHAAELHTRERAAMPVYRRLVTKHKLDMKPTDVEFLFDDERAVFYFVAEDRVDFRELVRDLAAEFHLRIDMRQIGVRDEARMVGGLGHCGEQLCCVRFGGEFQPVSIRMAKEQDLPLNPLKISGLCGRLMCCLRYEYDAYKDFHSRAPKKGAIIDIGGTLAKVVDMDTPRERITMRKEDGTRVTYALDEMECCCEGKTQHGAGCPCSVKAEAIERSISSMLEATPSGGQTRTRLLGESPAREAVVAPSATDGPARVAQAPGEHAGTGRRRRRRGGGGGGGESSPSAAGAPKPAGQPKPAKRQQPKGGAPKQAQPPRGDSPAAPGGASAPKRRRRRRRGGGSGGEGGSSAAGTAPSE
jgi:cell fate regulator YaaT (PSP1 superfamily)